MRSEHLHNFTRGFLQTKNLTNINQCKTAQELTFNRIYVFFLQASPRDKEGPVPRDGCAGKAEAILQSNDQ